MLAFCNAGYFNFTDIFMCAFFLSVLAVWLMRRFRWGFLAGAVCLVGSLGLYQSFMASACGLVTMLFILDALDGQTGPRGLAATASKGAGMALLGGVLYKVCMEAALRLTGVEVSTAYNTVAYVGNYDQYSIAQLIVDTYRYVAEYLFDWLPVHPKLYALGSIVLLVLTAWAVGRLIARSRSRSPMYAVNARGGGTRSGAAVSGQRDLFYLEIHARPDELPAGATAGLCAGACGARERDAEKSARLARLGSHGGCGAGAGVQCDIFQYRLSA